MNSGLRIAVFVGAFPVASETFILRQIAGLLELGHSVDIFADSHGDADAPVQPEIERYQLLKRTTWMEMPPESTPWEMPLWPVTGRTWLPGASQPVHNLARLARALPALALCFTHAPLLSFQLLSSRQYSYRAASLSGIYRMARLVGRNAHYDVLHAHFGPVGNTFRFARALWNAPLVVSFHGYDFSTLPRQEGREMYQRLFATADAITVNSQYTRQQVTNLGCPETKIRLLPMGLNPDEFPFRERSQTPGQLFRILSVGRLVEIKGHEYLVRAVGELHAVNPAVRCAIVGDGPFRNKLEELIRELGLQKIVTLHGTLERQAINRLMDEADAFVLVSVSVQGDQEGQGLALQEAQAAGLPVIATRHGALPEGIVENKSGFLIPERDSVALAERLEFLRQNPQVWAAMGREGRRFVEEHYDIRRLSRNLTAIYAQSIQEFPAD